MNTHRSNPYASSPVKSNRIHRLVRLALPTIILSLPAMAAPAVTNLQDRVTQYGITWTFDKPYPVGQYCNGDYFVVGPIVLTGPVSDGTNGTMINPLPMDMPTHGFDYRADTSFYGQDARYDATVNKGLNMPLAVAGGSSVLSCLSFPDYRRTLQLEHMACLTVVSEPPPEGSFRPTYFGTGNKNPTHNKSQIDYTKLQKLPLVAGADLAKNETRMLRSMFHLGKRFQANYLVAKYNCPYGGTAYGRETLLGFALVGLELNLNYTDTQKEKMAIGMIQQGLDLYTGIQQGLTFTPNGGQVYGHKLPVAMAGLLLNDSNILARLNPSAFPRVFADDITHFYVTQQDIDTPRQYQSDPVRYIEPYPQSALGMPEWGPDGGYPKNTAGHNWARVYRTVVGPNSVAMALAARLSGLEQAWAHPAFLDYCDRYYSIEKDQAADTTNEIKIFVKNMWEAYRETSAAQKPLDPAVPPTQPTGLKAME